MKKLLNTPLKIPTCLLIPIYLLLIGPLYSTYIYFLEEEILDKGKQTQLCNLILRAEPPRSFFNDAPLDLPSECLKLLPYLHREWIPPSLWQIAVLHAFFHNESIRDGILKCSGQSWSPIEYEEIVHGLLASAKTSEQIVNGFDSHTATIPDLCALFFKVNQAIGDLYRRSGGYDHQMLHLTLSEIPAFELWAKKQFPFWKCPWIYDPYHGLTFYKALKDENFLLALLNIERSAQQNGQWVLYRGYPGEGYPSTLHFNGQGSHALSFGSTLLGGAFFSLGAAPITYSMPTTPMEKYSFLALKVTPEELKDLFRVGPLHPFVQLLVDGEMFHVHTKIAAYPIDDYQVRSLNGYYMRSNKHCKDPIGYIFALKMTPQEMETAFQSLCQKSGTLFLSKNEDISGVLLDKK